MTGQPTISLPWLVAGPQWNSKHRDIDYRFKTFSCSRCGAEAFMGVVEPIREAGMEDYRLDEVERPCRHPAPSSA